MPTVIWGGGGGGMEVAEIVVVSLSLFSIKEIMMEIYLSL
jgi:hypothetical protein